MGVASLCSADQYSWGSCSFSQLQCYVGHFGVLEEHSQNARAVSAML